MIWKLISISAIVVLGVTLVLGSTGLIFNNTIIEEREKRIEELIEQNVLLKSEKDSLMITIGELGSEMEELKNDLAKRDVRLYLIRRWWGRIRKKPLPENPWGVDVGLSEDALRNFAWVIIAPLDRRVNAPLRKVY